MVGFQLKEYKVTVSYDATTSSLGNYNNRYGAYELSLVKTGIYGGGDKSLKCPQTKICEDTNRGRGFSAISSCRLPIFCTVQR